MIAIIIPYYNLRFFDQTLKSLANQINKNFKVYIFNDNSPENPLFLIEKYANCFNYEYNKFEDNLGSTSLVKHWHRCIQNINEKWYSIIGDDDLLDTNYIATFYKNLSFIEEQNIHVIRYASILIDDHGKQIKDLLVHPKVENSKDSLIRKLEGNSRSSLSEYIYENLGQNNQYFVDFPNAYYSDDLSLLLATNFGNIYTINDAVVQIRRGNFNLSGVNSNVKKANEAEFLFYKKLLNNYHKKFDIAQKKLFLHKLNRLVVRTKSFTVFLFVIKNQIKIYNFRGILYLPKLVINKFSSIFNKIFI